MQNKENDKDNAMKIKLNVDLLKHKAGTTITIKDVDGIPVDQYWYRRLKDAKKDNCIEVISGSQKSTTYKKKTEEKVDDDSSI